MGELVDLRRILRDRELERALGSLRARLPDELPGPEAFGWTVAGHDDLGHPNRWMNLPYRAFVGRLDDGRVYLDRDHRLLAWEGLSVEELVVGLQTGFVPPPDVTLDGLGEPG